MAKNDTYKEVRVYHYPNITAKVLIPDITPEERARRMAFISEAAARLLSSSPERQNEEK